MPEIRRPKTRTAKIIEGVGEELKENPPGVLERTKRRSGKAAAERQRRAILLSKARKRGADIPENPNK
jgi:hypothetical protein